MSVAHVATGYHIEGHKIQPLGPPPRHVAQAWIRTSPTKPATKMERQLLQVKSQIARKPYIFSSKKQVKESDLSVMFLSTTIINTPSTLGYLPQRDRKQMI